MILSDLGAEVIKIEPPGGEETRTHPPMVRGQSVYFSVSKTPGRIGPVPTPGQHTDEIIGNVLGYDPSTIGSLRSAGAIA